MEGVGFRTKWSTKVVELSIFVLSKWGMNRGRIKSGANLADELHLR